MQAEAKGEIWIRHATNTAAPVPRLAPPREAESTLPTGERGHRNDLVLANIGFLVSVARTYRNTGLPMEDLVNEGALGLLEAARRFEPERDVRFITYAAWWIHKSIRTLAERSHIVRIPNYRLRLVREAKDRVGPRSDSGFLDALARNGLRTVSVDDGQGDRSLANRLTLANQADPEHALLTAESVDAVNQSVDLLSTQQRAVIRARFGLDGGPVGTLRSIGSSLGVSRERVRQIEIQAVARLRRLLIARGCGGAKHQRERVRPPRPLVTRSSSVCNNPPVHSRRVKNANPLTAPCPAGERTIRLGHPLLQEETRE